MINLEAHEITQMNIIILSDEYMPDGTRAHAKMLHELAISLQNAGHKLIVITPNIKDHPDRLIVDSIDGVEVWKFRSKPTRGVSLFTRAINEIMLSPRAWIAVRGKLKEKHVHMCINYSPTIFFAGFALLMKWRGAYVYLILRDFFPQWMVDQGRLSTHSPITKFFRVIEKINYKISNKIGVQSPANKAIFVHKNKHMNEKCEVLYNWATTRKTRRTLSQRVLSLIEPLSNKTIFFYGGNMGHAQDMRNLLKLAESLSHLAGAHFLFVGEGDQAKLVDNASQVMSNVTYHPSISQEEYSTLLTRVDVGLITLAAEHTSHNFPGKILGYMSQGLPILGSVNSGNDLKSLIGGRQAGFVLYNGEDEKLSSMAKKLLHNPSLRAEMGTNSTNLFHDKFSLDNAVSSLLKAYNGRLKT